MLNVNATQPFLPPHQPAQPPPPQQPGIQGQPHLPFMSNHPGSVPQGVLGGPQGPAGLGPNHPSYPLHIRQGSAQRTTSFGQQPHNGPAFNSQIPGGPSHLNGMGHGPMQSTPFAGQPMQPGIRRVPSQGQPLNPAMTGMGGQPAVGTVSGMPGMNVIGMSHGLMRQGPQIPTGRPLPPSMMQSPGHIPEMNMHISHQQPQIRGSGSIIPAASRVHSFTSNPPSAQPLAGGIQPPLHPQGFQNGSGGPQNLATSPHVSPPHSAGIAHQPMNHPANIPPMVMNRHRMTPDNPALMNHLPQNSSQPANLSTINSTFNYVPGNRANDSSQFVGPNSQTAGGRTGLVSTPAAALLQMNPPNTEGFSFNGLPQQQPGNLRPPSRPGSHAHAPVVPSQGTPQGQLQQPSLSQQAQRPPSAMTVKRSPSRAASVQGQSPSSQTSLQNAQSPRTSGQPRTPRISQPASATPSQPANTSARHAPHSQQPLAPVISSADDQSSVGSAPLARGSQIQMGLQNLSPAPLASRYLPYLVSGGGGGINRILSFSGGLAAESPDRLQLSYWHELVENYFSPHAMFKFTLWKDNQRSEAKLFEIGVPILPRFFLVTSQSGVKTMHLNLDGVRERATADNRFIVECTHAIWTFRYNNGYVVTLRGPLSATMSVHPTPMPHGPTIPLCKFDALSFDANHHDKMISLEAIAGFRILPTPTVPPTPMIDGLEKHEEEDTRVDEPKIIIERAVMPAEPVNAFGIPQATMRCLELAESVAQMADLIQFSRDSELGPLDALKEFAKTLRDSHSGPMGISHIPNMGATNNDVKPTVPSDNSNTLANASSPSFMGTSAGSNPQTQPASSSGLSAATDTKMTKNSLAQAQGVTSSPSSQPTSATTPAAASTPGASTNTPRVAAATLKRKAAQADTGSSSAGNHDSAPPAKRTARKRGKTQGG